MTVRFLVVAAITALCLLAARRAQTARAQPSTEGQVGVRLPLALVAGAARTWVLFTTQWCATCGPAEERLRAADPEARLVRVDAAAEPALARALKIRRSPTAVLAAADGTVLVRLVGPEAVAEWAATAGADPGR